MRCPERHYCKSYLILSLTEWQATERNEEWCKSKLLGSLLESRDDVMKRSMLGDVAFQKLMKVWSQSQFPLQKKAEGKHKLFLYPDLQLQQLGNALPNSYWDRLDAFHRRHLRKIMNVSWPRSLVSNDTFYQRCSSTPLSKRAELSRWKMLDLRTTASSC